MTKAKSTTAKKSTKTRAKQSRPVKAKPQTSEKPVNNDEVFIATPENGLCESGVAEFRDELRDAIDLGHTKMAIDLAKVTGIDGQGLALIAQCQNSLQEQGGELAVLTRDSHWQELLKFTGLSDRISVRESLS